MASSCQMAHARYLFFEVFREESAPQADDSLSLVILEEALVSAVPSFHDRTALDDCWVCDDVCQPHELWDNHDHLDRVFVGRLAPSERCSICRDERLEVTRAYDHFEAHGSRCSSRGADGEAWAPSEASCRWQVCEIVEEASPFSISQATRSASRLATAFAPHVPYEQPSSVSLHPAAFRLCDEETNAEFGTLFLFCLERQVHRQREPGSTYRLPRVTLSLCV